MKLWCPFCGAAFSWGRARRPKVRDWVLHAWNCYDEYGGRWLPAGTNREVPWTYTHWQVKRRSFIRDSVANPEDPWSPWSRFPVCQSCGRISRGTVDAILHGRADGFEAQHILPIHRGGTNDPRNVAPLCRRCHLRTFKRGYAGVPAPHRVSRLPDVGGPR
jgi:5-methylcytosine-specific restriction endonuclease McrA